MEDKEDQIRLIFTSDVFRNSTDQKQTETIRKIIESKEVPEERVFTLLNQAQKVAELDKLPYNIFAKVLLAGDLKGDDLLAVCNSSTILRDYCNKPLILPTNQEVSQYLFRQLIEKERPGYVYEGEPREVYKALTTRGITDFANLLTFIDKLNQQSFSMEYEISLPRTIQSLLYVESETGFGLLFNTLPWVDQSIPNLR
jgi:hypothetical protein